MQHGGRLPVDAEHRVRAFRPPLELGLKVEPRPPYSSLLSLVSAWCAEVHPPVPPCASGRLPLVGTLPAEATACVFVSLAAAAVAPKQRTAAVKAPPSHCPVPHARRGSAAL